ncbi:hypothetical protein N9C56_13935, partial [Paracoccaceae bacterium]|nr:hypothetical protein [Paracoccaceae bacterium]
MDTGSSTQTYTYLANLNETLFAADLIAHPTCVQLFGKLCHNNQPKANFNQKSTQTGCTSIFSKNLCKPSTE